MKLAPFILLFFHATCFAQHFMIGIDGGISSNSIPKDRPALNYGGGGQSVMRLGSSFDIKVGLELPKHVEAGIGLNCMFLWYENTLSYKDPTPVAYNHKYITYYMISFPAIPIYVFVNKKVQLPHGFFYYGFAAGYVHSSAGESGLIALNATIDHVNLAYRQAYSDANGIYTAITAGYAVRLHKRLYINIEGAVKFLSMQSKNPSTINVLCFPLTIGLQYRK